MALAKVRLDHAGIGQILRSSEVASEVHALAAQVAANVASQGLVASSAGPDSPAQIIAVVDDYTTDRAASAVTILHPAGLAMQARHGVLTKAAAAAGLEVKS